MSRPDILHVVIDPTDDDIPVLNPEIRWWLPILGPTSLALLILLNTDTPATGGASYPLNELAYMVGLSNNCYKLYASVERIHMFKAGHMPSTDVLVVRSHLPKLTERQLARFPDALANRYLYGTEVPS